MADIKTHIATSDAASITIRGLDLVNDLIGKRSFSAMVYFLVRGRMPTDNEIRVLDACLVTLMEHGWTPTSIVTRFMIDSVPNQAQVAIAAGLLAAGDVFVGTIEGCARILAGGILAADQDAYCDKLVGDYRSRRQSLPGFGHPVHKPDDPRPPRLFAVARECGYSGKYIELLHRLSAAVDRAMGRHLTINATGAIAALFLEIDLQPDAMRGLAIVARAAGLAGHIVEERKMPAARRIWQLAEQNIPYESPEAEDTN